MEIDDEEISPASKPFSLDGIQLTCKFLNVRNETTIILSNDDLTVRKIGYGWFTIGIDSAIDFTSGFGKYFIKFQIDKNTDCNGIGAVEKSYQYGGVNQTILGYESGGKSWSWFTYSYHTGFISNLVNFGTPDDYVMGDIVKLVFDASDRSITYYRNDELVSKPFMELDVDEIIPAVTVCGDGDQITIINY